MRLPRLSIRRMMLAVAVLGFILGNTIVLCRRAADFERRSADYRERWIEDFKASGATVGDSPKRRRKLGYLAQMDLKYRHAARYPWLPVAPDPPEPK